MARHFLTFMMLHTYLMPFIAIAAMITWFFSFLPVRSVGEEKRDVVIARSEQMSASSAVTNATSTAISVSTTESSWHYVRTVTGNMTERGLASGGVPSLAASLSTFLTSTVSPGSSVTTSASFDVIKPLETMLMSVTTSHTPINSATTQTVTDSISARSPDASSYQSPKAATYLTTPYTTGVQSSDQPLPTQITSRFSDGVELASTSIEEPAVPLSQGQPSSTQEQLSAAATTSKSSTLYFSSPSASAPAVSLSTSDILSAIHINPVTTSTASVTSAEASSSGAQTTHLLPPSPAAASSSSAIADGSATATTLLPFAISSTTTIPDAAQTSSQPFSSPSSNPSHHTSATLARLGIGVAAAVLMVLIIAAAVGVWQYKKRMEERRKSEVEEKAVWYVHRTYTVERAERAEAERDGAGVGLPRGWVDDEVRGEGPVLGEGGGEPVLGVNAGQKGKARWTLTMPVVPRLGTGRRGEGWKGLDG